MKMKPLLTRAMPFAMMLAAPAAEAHPGHMAAAAGHAHWIGLAALGAAIALAAWAALKGPKTSGEKAEGTDEEAEEDTTQEV